MLRFVGFNKDTWDVNKRLQGIDEERMFYNEGSSHVSTLSSFLLSKEDDFLKSLDNHYLLLFKFDDVVVLLS